MRYLLSLSVLILFSCSSMKKQAQSGDSSNALSGSHWTLNSIPGFELEGTRKPVTLSFADTTDRVFGNAGCNGFGGRYVVKGNTLKMEKLISTKMACMPGMATENKVLILLTEADHFRISGDKLSLMQGDKVLAEYSQGKKDEK